MGKSARRVSDRTVEAGTAKQLGMLLTNTLAAHTRGDSRQDLRVRNPRLADLRVARRRGRGNGLSHMRLGARVTKEPGNAFATGAAAKGAHASIVIETAQHVSGPERRMESPTWKVWRGVLVAADSQACRHHLTANLSDGLWICSCKGVL